MYVISTFTVQQNEWGGICVQTSIFYLVLTVRLRYQWIIFDFDLVHFIKIHFWLKNSVRCKLKTRDPSILKCSPGSFEGNGVPVDISGT